MIYGQEYRLIKRISAKKIFKGITIAEMVGQPYKSSKESVIYACNVVHSFFNMDNCLLPNDFSAINTVVSTDHSWFAHHCLSGRLILPRGIRNIHVTMQDAHGDFNPLVSGENDLLILSFNSLVNIKDDLFTPGSGHLHGMWLFLLWLWVHSMPSYDQPDLTIQFFNTVELDRQEASLINLLPNVYCDESNGCESLSSYPDYESFKDLYNNESFFKFNDNKLFKMNQNVLQIPQHVLAVWMIELCIDGVPLNVAQRYAATSTSLAPNMVPHFDMLGPADAGEIGVIKKIGR